MPDTPDFCKLADAYGIASRRIEDEKDIDDAVKEMLTTDGPFLLECRVDPEEATMMQ